jgi:hypothetical protein
MADERTLITDVIVPEIYQGYTAVNGPEKTAFFESGVASRDAGFDALARQGGRIVHIPFWNDLDGSLEPSYSNDSMTAMEPSKVTADEMKARVSYMNQAYRAPDLINELSGSDPIQRVRDRFGAYWARAYQRRVLAIMKGLYNDNVNANSSDMVKDVSGTNTENDDDAKFSTINFLDALATSGDRQDDYRVIAVHSHIYTRMKKNNLIDFIPDSQGQLTIATYLGLRVVVDDLMLYTAAAGAGGSDAAAKYTCIIFGGNVLAYGEGNPRNPVYIERSELKGNGGGMEVIGERKTMLIHPYGYEFTSNTVTGVSPTLAELELHANWTRVIDRKNIPLAYLVVNN